MTEGSNKIIDLIPILESGEPQKKIELGKAAREVCGSMQEFYQRIGFHPPWIGYLVTEEDRCVGTCAFKSQPTEQGVEIAYFTFPEFEGKGMATRMAQKLIELARQQQPKITITAQTLPKKNASTSVLKKLGFSWQGDVMHLEDGKVWQWELVP